MSAPAGRTRSGGRSRPSSGRTRRTSAERARSRSRWPTRTRPATRVEGAALQTGVGFQPDYATEGKHEALEFAAGNYGLLESALEYARDDEDPRVRMTGPRCSSGPIEITFEWINEPSVIRYTTDGSQAEQPVRRCGTPPARASPVRRST